ncbi:MAG: hypothetical protein V4651_08570 [Bacteroidota bacterium]
MSQPQRKHEATEPRKTNSVCKRRVLLNEGRLSPILGGVFGKMSDVLVAALSYDACVALNRAYSLRASLIKHEAGGAYRAKEHFMLTFIHTKTLRASLYSALYDWLCVHAPHISHKTAINRALEYLILMHMADHNLHAGEIRELTGTESVYVTLAKLRKSGLIDLGGYVQCRIVKDGKVLKRARCYVLTQKGKTLVSLACDVMERKESTLRSMLLNKS